MIASEASGTRLWRVIVVGGHTRSIGKTQLVCDVIRAFPKTRWIAGKITQYGHGVCTRNGRRCDCAPDEHICALNWESHSDTGTDSARFLAAGAERSFWLRTKQGHLAEGLPLLRGALGQVVDAENSDGAGAGNGSNGGALIVESNSLLQFLRPSLYFAVIDPGRKDFKGSARMVLDRADALVLRGEVGQEVSPAPLWMSLPAKLLQERPSVVQREGENLPEPLGALVQRVLEAPPEVRV